jgi:hypothetical protein
LWCPLYIAWIHSKAIFGVTVFAHYKFFFNPIVCLVLL